MSSLLTSKPFIDLFATKWQIAKMGNLYSQFVLIKLGNLQSKFKLHMSLHQKKIILYQQHLFQVLKLRKLPSKECRICKKHVHITY